MKILQKKENNILKVTIIGDLDASSSIEMDNVIINAFNNGDNNVMVDCGKLKYISSAGVGVFVSYLKDFEDKKGKLVLYNLQENVMNVFQILGLENIMDIRENEDQAKITINES